MRATSIALAVAAVGLWPFATCYTSFGLDTERAVDGQVRCDWWRVRWPGDGSVGLCHETALRERGGGPIERWDLGGVFFANTAPPGARDAMQLVMPHWLLVAATVSLAGFLTFGRGTARRGAVRGTNP